MTGNSRAMNDNCDCEFCSPEPEPIPAPWERTGDDAHDVPPSLPEPEPDETPTLTLSPLTPR
ncbi:MAG TPA: hypothetical protein VFU65_19640 [Actinocrinis sp.]|nr:hypothetical protein [Actinocrinis sp.]